MSKEYWVVKKRDGSYYPRENIGKARLTYCTEAVGLILFRNAQEALGFAGYGDRLVKVKVEEEEVMDEGYRPKPAGIVTDNKKESRFK